MKNRLKVLRAERDWSQVDLTNDIFTRCPGGIARWVKDQVKK